MMLLLRPKTPRGAVVRPLSLLIMMMTLLRLQLTYQRTAAPAAQQQEAPGETAALTPCAMNQARSPRKQGRGLRHWRQTTVPKQQPQQPHLR